MKVGIMAPGFVLPDQNGKEHSLADLRGKWVLLYFYPKDDTPGCTKEACSIRDALPDLSKLKAEVLGVSVDSVASHKKFAEKYNLTFTLLADTQKKIVKKYGAWAKKKFMGREHMGTLRRSFLVDPKGRVVRVYDNVDPLEHAQEVLDDLKSFKSGQRPF
ncbi:MAG: thiol peroxidase [Candidatus Yanofskybacteria bacterium RIFCSPHIGHO2_01_FULL_44_17]|uniref:thioredoxin-dependent peroxiredoxin n=1 Tax=Candidatus Yanofskybacteria bacterium RIFCSPHIGHO2_01_FULL_44_17 TaxID=1802668 RepID=A0A1F8EXB9_9BACT|nr:MAG: thiol peroxidase [Candidatus Yanofskybacteria bacterium RIFCSPHIGHO2_01_FULL_44_17]